MLRRRDFLGAAAVLPCVLERALGQDETVWYSAYRAVAARLIGEAMGSRFAWERLAELCDGHGARLSGSPGMESSIRWAVEKMKEDGLENVRAEPVMVPRWVRGRESVEVVAPSRQPMVMLGLGGSVGTPPDGIEAEALVVGSFDELEANAAKASGRIVVFNVPFTNYGQTVSYRSAGPSRAAKLGAVAVLVRSVGPAGFRTPHTGALSYSEAMPKIPSAAVTVEDAEMLQRMQDRGSRIVIRLRMEARTEPDVEGANVVGEVRGGERPEECVVIGGHFDSWDPGTGAMDDGGGCIATWEAVRIVRKLGLRPRRTLRVVLFANEENGLRGGLGYRDRHKDELSRHVMMLESDSGVFRPNGFGFSGSDASRAKVRKIAALLRRIGADRISAGGGGADIGPSVAAGGIPSMSLDVDGSRYFLLHHTPADTVDKIDPLELSMCVAAIAVMSYGVADMPERL
jgi:carboxypeptidase Q